jgi:uncharacterized Zn-finger protein
MFNQASDTEDSLVFPTNSQASQVEYGFSTSIFDAYTDFLPSPALSSEQESLVYLPSMDTLGLLVAASNNSTASEESFPCLHENCGKMFTKYFNLKSHMKVLLDFINDKKTHEIAKEFECSICQTSFRRTHDLKRHVRYTNNINSRSVHINQKAFNCLLCFKKFSRADALKRHSKRIGSSCRIE